jgi:hypothetical protein
VTRLLPLLAVLLAGPATAAADPVKLPPGVVVEAEVTDPAAAKVVLIAGTNVFKPGEHDYVAGCCLLMDLLKQTPGVAPVLALDWPKKPATFRGAKAVVFFFDGGDKHHVLKGNRVAEVQKLIDAGAGLVQLHQAADYPADLGDRVRGWAGGAWHKGAKRAHWVATFRTFPPHPIFNGVAPFTIDDGWLWQNTFVPRMAGVTPLQRTVDPKGKDDPAADSAIVAWAYERPAGGRAFTFTGAHLHKSFDQEGYRRMLTNAALWAAGREISPSGSPVVRPPSR